MLDFSQMALPPGVRLATEADLECIMEIERLSFDRQWDVMQFKAGLKDIFLVYGAPEALGFLVACVCDLTRRGIILRVATHHDSRGQGVASKLLAAAIDCLRCTQVNSIDLDVEIVKQDARSLYEKFGFKVSCATLTDFDYEEESFYMMKLVLNDGAAATAGPAAAP